MSVDFSVGTVGVSKAHIERYPASRRTSISYRRWTHAQVHYPEADAQCDKLAKVVELTSIVASIVSFLSDCNFLFCKVPLYNGLVREVSVSP